MLESVDGGRACTLRHWLTEEDVRAVLLAHDADGDGRLSAAEFEAMASTDGLLLRGSLAEYEAAFDAADADGDGLVGATELADLLRALGRPVTYDELVATMRDFDVDASGKLDFFEVLRMFKKSVLDLDEVRERERERERGGKEKAFCFPFFCDETERNGLTLKISLAFRFFFLLPPLSPLLPPLQVLDYVRLTPTKSGAALDAAAHSERRKKAKAAAAAAAAAAGGGASTLEGEATAEGEAEAASGGGSLVTSVYSEEELDDLLASRGGAPTVLMASVTWCRPCRALAKPYLSLAERYAPSARDASDGVLFAKLYGNASDEAKLLFRDKLKVRVTPTFFVFGAAAPGEPTTALHSHTGANKAKLEHAVREAIAARGGDVGGAPLYPPERKPTGGW